VDKSMKISPCYRAEDWIGLTFTTEQDWQKGVAIFVDRIQGRFLDEVACIEKNEFAGFAVLALDCLLIETLQQFREGVKETPARQAKNYFVRFLTQTSFNQWFDKDTACMFYKQIRCGILHQAETKGTSRVVIRSGVPLAGKTPDGQGLVINRRLFHAQLKKGFQEYANNLREGTDKELRKKFRRKMSYICNLP